MITGEIKAKLDKLWNSMWANQMTNPWIDIQQLTYLIFIKMLDDNQLKKEAKINDMIAHGIKVEGTFYNSLTFKKGNYVNKDNGNNIDVPYSNLRWSVFKEFSPEIMYTNMRDHVFPFIKSLKGSDGSTAFAKFMKEAQFQVPKPSILSDIVSALDDKGLGLDKVDFMGDCYEYLLSKMSTSGDNGQFRTPRHIIDMMVNIVKPTLKDNIIDPAMGTAGFLAESAKYLQEHYEKELLNKENADHFHNNMFTGFDVDWDMLRIGCMNMTLHGVENPRIEYNDSLSEDYKEGDKYSLILANPPFAGIISDNSISKSLTVISGGTKKKSLLFLALFIRLLKVGGRCASIFDVGVVNNTNEKAYNKLRKELVDNQKLEAIIYMPANVFKPYSGVQAVILVFTKTNSGGTDKVWLYNMEADGFSLDDKRQPVIENDIPDIEKRFDNLKDEEERTPYEKSFFITKQDIINNDYVLSFNRYQKRHIEKKTYRPTKEIFESIEQSEKEFADLLNKIKEELAKK